MTENHSGTSPRFSFFPNEELENDVNNLPLTLLIAEDDWATRDLLQRYLSQNENYNVIAVDDGLKAWKILERDDDPPQLALLDWMMPGMDGIELCRRIKARGLPFVYTIMLTARAQNDDIIKGLEAGAHEFLAKPFDIHVLKSRVAAGERIVKMEKLLKMKNQIIQEYVEKLESQI